MEAGVGEAPVDLANPLPVDAETQQAKGNVDPVRAAEGLHQGFGGRIAAGELVVLDDHGVNFVAPALQAVLFQVVAGEPRRRRQIVEGARQPDAGVVEEAGQLQLAQIVAGQRALRRHQVDHPVNVVSIGGLIPPEALRVVVEQAVQFRQFGDKPFHYCPWRGGRPRSRYSCQLTRPGEPCHARGGFFAFGGSAGLFYSRTK